ncbi:MAG: GNAT family N-acetyltransferase [Chitinophagaceae bacterium]|nr:GNAT family N-acetyltransferase [Chitinophagaceae bacterium]
MINYERADTDEAYKNAALLFKAYASWLNIDLGFQHFDKELKEIKVMYGEPGGGIILCKTMDEYIGCAGIRKIDSNTAELKRMFIKPAWQKLGIGKTLLEKAVELARELNYTTIRLDTLNYMTPAIKLYKNYGFYEIPAYYNNPNATAVYFEKKY